MMAVTRYPPLSIPAILPAHHGHSGHASHIQQMRRLPISYPELVVNGSNAACNAMIRSARYVGMGRPAWPV
jgi:hypothetical protein